MKRVRNGKAYLQAGFFMSDPVPQYPRMSMEFAHRLSARSMSHTAFRRTISCRDGWKDDYCWKIEA
ncbi:MAG: hypothetical protein AB7I42_25975 [Bradyrhizobium sp.]|uniref:hypothetical protein n=1 Tax=Bradyrhizobium sp. TaxID=376 RepID=UPI003D0E3239